MKIQRAVWTTSTLLCSIFGAVVGYVIASYYSQVTVGTVGLQFPRSPLRDQFILFWLRPLVKDPFVPPSAVPPLFIVLTLGFAVIFFRIGSWVADHLVGLIGRIHSMTVVDRVLGIAGALLGMIFGVLLTLPLANLASEQSIWLSVQLMALMVCAGFGMSLMMGMRNEMLRVFPKLDSKSDVEEARGAVPKLLDTNIIIDGRITELCKTGFLEGPLIVPGFVLDEVQYLADSSSDSLRRARGKRGLDVLKAIKDLTEIKPGSAPEQNETTPLVRFLIDVPASVAAVETVDGKLVALAKEMHAAIVTNDFNLNRVAEIHGVRVLNLNELAQSLKPVVVPGEEMDLMLVKEGDRPGQGVGYLDDGTLVVVSDAGHHIGQTCRIVISQLRQTVAGKMIFADLKTRDAGR